MTIVAAVLLVLLGVALVAIGLLYRKLKLTKRPVIVDGQMRAKAQRRLRNEWNFALDPRYDEERGDRERNLGPAFVRHITRT